MKINKISSNCVYIQIDGLNTFHVRIGNLSGSRFEPAGMNGVAHLTEHLTSFSLDSDFDKLDPFFFVSEINAMTFNEVVYSWITTTKEYWERGLTTLARLFSLERFEEKLFVKEQKVVYGAALQWEKCADAYEKVFDYTYKTLFGSHPLAGDAVGSSADTMKLTADDCFDFYKENYLGRKMSLVIFGGVDVNELRSKIGELGLLEDDTFISADSPELPEHNFKINNIDFDTVTPEIITAYRIDPDEYRDSFLLELAHFIIGGSNEKSVIFKQLRDTMQVAYDTRTHIHSYSDVDLLLVYYGLSEKNDSIQIVNQVYKIIDEIEKYTSEKEFEIFKTAFIDRTKLNLEIPIFSSEYYTKRILTNRAVNNLAEFEKKVSGISYQDFLDFCKITLIKEKSATTILEKNSIDK